MDNHLSIKNIAIFASGAGSNMLNIARYFAGSPVIRVRLVVSSNPRAGVLAHAAECGIEAIVTSREELNDPHGLADILASRDIDYIVLAGWLWLLPAHIVEAYRGRIVNIHPSLLPAFGGRGMYGHHVHEAVIAAGCRRRTCQQLPPHREATGAASRLRHLRGIFSCQSFRSQYSPQTEPNFLLLRQRVPPISLATEPWTRRWRWHF